MNQLLINPRALDDPQPPAEEAFDSLLEWIFDRGYDEKDVNFEGTALRAAKGFAQLVLPPAAIENEVAKMMQKRFPTRSDGMVLCKHNICFSLCPHHLLPVIYRVSVAYIPEEHVIGISKLSRLTWLLSRRPTLQEDLTADLADVLYANDDRPKQYQGLKTKGSAVYVEGLHLCMAARGIESAEARVSTQELRGIFLTQPATRQEFVDAVTRNAPALIP